MHTRPAPLHPMLLIAAVAVTALSVTGIASLTGWLPALGSAPATLSSLPAQAEVATVRTSTPAPPATLHIPTPGRITIESTPAVAPIPATTPVRQAQPRVESPPPAPREAATVPPAPRPMRVSTERMTVDNGIDVEQVAPRREMSCSECATIISVRTVRAPGPSTGLGAVAGGLLGGLAGKQMGKGNGNKALTVAGVIGGAYAGHQVEKSMRAEEYSEVVVRYDNGGERTLRLDSDGGWRAGDPVRVRDGALFPR